MYTTHKKLKSGIIVEDEQYYKLLEWKDKYPEIFQLYCKSKNYPISINNMTIEQYDDLLLYSQTFK